jgi:hypothetical protein
MEDGRPYTEKRVTCGRCAGLSMEDFNNNNNNIVYFTLEKDTLEMGNFCLYRKCPIYICVKKYKYIKKM